MISYRYQYVGWSVLDVALSPDGGHLVYSSWSDSLHQVGDVEIEIRIMIEFSNCRRTSWTKIMIMIMIGEHLGQRGSTS